MDRKSRLLTSDISYMGLLSERDKKLIQTQDAKSVKARDEEIHDTLKDFVNEIIKAPIMHGDKQIDIILAQDFIKWWQALKRSID